MTLLNTSGVLVILTVILLLWFVPRSLRRAPAYLSWSLNVP